MQKPKPRKGGIFERKHHISFSQTPKFAREKEKKEIAAIRKRVQ
jgi:hypothetical protein